MEVSRRAYNVRIPTFTISLWVQLDVNYCRRCTFCISLESPSISPPWDQVPAQEKYYKIWFFFLNLISNYDWKQAQENVKYQDIQIKKQGDVLNRAESNTQIKKCLKNVKIGRQCSPSDKMMLLKKKKIKLLDYWCICKYCVIVKHLRMDISASGNAKNLVSHPLQYVLTENTAEKCKCSWTMDLAADVTDADRLCQSGNLKVVKKSLKMWSFLQKKRNVSLYTK